MRLQGEWAAVQLVLDGNELPSMMLPTGLRTATQNQVKVTFGGQLMVDALVRIDERADPIYIDYFNRCGQAKGQVQLGIIQWVGEEACIIMARARPPPAERLCVPSRQRRTLSRWRPKTGRGN